MGEKMNDGSARRAGGGVFQARGSEISAIVQ